MSYAVLDCETTITNKGNPFTKCNKLCMVGIWIEGVYSEFDIEYGGEPYGEHLQAIKMLLESVDFVVGFNIKFDLQWIKRYVHDLDIRCVFDTQLADFLLNHQRYPYPSLNDACARCGLGSKLDTIEQEYWRHGIDTTDIPRDALSPYLEQDVALTRQLYEKQRELMTPAQRKLMYLQGQDLLILMEMERNGLDYDKERAAELGRKSQEKLAEIDRALRELVGSDVVNFGSDDHISCLLYGGEIYERYRFTYERELKDGSKVQRERWEERPVPFAQMVRPLKGTETKPTDGMDDGRLRECNLAREAEGKKPYQRHWSVAEPVLKRLKLTKKARKIVDLMLERSYLDKLDSTYYTGLVEKMNEVDSVDGRIHGRFNQVVARTGRLSSSDPNLQNFSGDIKELFVTRFV
jgi:DNA polymerase I-like protein with 3'-5' exonuclease and polymerase domains